MNKYKLFKEVFDNYATFKTSWELTPFATYTEGSETKHLLSDGTLQQLYYLIYARYNESHIVATNVEQWKARFWSITFQFAPTWQKRLEIQQNLRDLTENEIRTGIVQKVTRGFNPSTIPSGPNTGDQEIDSVDSQSLMKYSKGKLEGYSNLTDLLKTDVTVNFLAKYKPLFRTVLFNIYPEDTDDE